MDDAQIKFYFAYTSPYTYLAWEPAKALERSHRVRVRFVPFGVNIRRVYDDVPIRSERNRHKLYYLYLDARRMAKERGVVIYPPKKIFSARFAFYGGMCAAVEVESPDALAAILEEVGADTTQFRSYISDENADAKPRLKAYFAEADRDQVFGVPTFVIAGELFWGYDRIDWAVKKLDSMGLRR